jgi:phosphoglycerate dehydrogenase-like enzyme
VDGSIPKAFYSTADEASFGEFLSQSQILVASLPSTPATKWLLTKEHLAKLPKDALFINVGRGDLVHSEDLLASLDSKDGIVAAGLDVTDPEPLPDNHPLLSHPARSSPPTRRPTRRRTLTRRQTSSLPTLERLREGGKPINRIDPVKGY